MQRMVIISFAFVVLWGISPASLSPQIQPSETTKKLMGLKLDYMRHIMQSIIEQDFESIQNYSFRMNVLIGTSDWQVIRTEEYLRHTDEFRNAVEGLQGALKHRDIDTSTLAYMVTMFKCVQCHKYVKRFRTESER